MKYDETAEAFQASLAQVMALALQAVQDCGWIVVQADGVIGFLVLETKWSGGSWSGVTCTLTFFEVTPTWWRVTGAGKQNVRGAQLFAFDMGEATATANRAIQRMQDIAPR